MHANAPTHTAYIVVMHAALGKMRIEVLIWPRYSPDLNLIMNLWALLKAKIYKIRPDLINDETKNTLVETAQIAWQNINVWHIEHLLGAMLNRVEAIFESKGWYTPH